MRKEIVVLVHGFFKAQRDMRYLEQGLREAGYETLSVNLPTTLGSMEECVDSLSIQIANLEKEYSINYVAHSMGGLIVRAYVASHGNRNVGKCVFISTPHGGSGLASIAESVPFFSSIFKPIRAFLPTSGYRRISKKEGLRVGVIAGSRSAGIMGKLFLKKPSDGRVEVECVAAKDADESIVLPFGHKEIHHQYCTLLNVLEFLQSGSFQNTTCLSEVRAT